MSADRLLPSLPEEVVADLVLPGPRRPHPDETLLRRRRGRSWYRRRRRARLRRLLLLLYVAVGVCVLQLLWAVLQMQQAERRLDAARAALEDGDLDSVAAELAVAHHHAERAGWGTAGPHLAGLELLPVLGDDVDAVRELVAATRTVTGPLAGDLLGLRETLAPERLRPVEGYVDVDRLVRAGDVARDTVPTLADLDERLSGLDAEALLPGLEERVLIVQEEVGELHAAVEYGTGILDMAPALLGMDGPRSYLVVFQNNAELRATGGIPTAFAVLDADRGHLAMRDEGTSPDIRGARPGEPVLPETAEEAALFDGKLATFLGNATLTPSWPRAAELATSDGRPTVGVFLNDSTATKLHYFVTSRTQVTRLACRADGGQELLLTTEVRSAVPPHAARFPDLLVGDPLTGTPGEVLLTVAAYGPAGSTIEAATLDGHEGGAADYTLEGHPVVARSILLAPGETRSLTWTVSTAAGDGAAPRLRTTPGALTSGRGAVVATPCA